MRGLDNNEEAKNLVENFKGSTENRMRSLYNLGYWQGFNDGQREAVQMLERALMDMTAEQTEPQTDCGDFADRLAYERGVKHAWEVAQKVFDSTVTFYEAKDVAKQIDKDINVRSKDEPQTDCPWK